MRASGSTMRGSIPRSTKRLVSLSSPCPPSRRASSNRACSAFKRLPSPLKTCSDLLPANSPSIIAGAELRWTSLTTADKRMPASQSTLGKRFFSEAIITLTFILLRDTKRSPGIVSSGTKPLPNKTLCASGSPGTGHRRCWLASRYLLDMRCVDHQHAYADAPRATYRIFNKIPALYTASACASRAAAHSAVARRSRVKPPNSLSSTCTSHTEARTRRAK